MKPLIHCHVRKTGGTSLHRTFQSVVGQDGISPGHGSEQYSNALRIWSQTKIISQHLWFAPGEALTHERLNVTVLRNPVDRCISNYYYVRTQEDIFNADFPERQLTLEALAFSGTPYARLEYENFQSKLFAPIALTPGEMPTTAERLLKAAIAALEQFEVVGVTERLDETVDLISYLSGMHPLESIPKERASLRPSTADVPSGLRKRLEEQNQLDMELYMYAAKRLNRSVRRCFFALLQTQPVAEAPKGCADVSEPAATLRDSNKVAAPRNSPLRFGSKEIVITAVDLRGDVSLCAPELVSGERVTVAIRCKSQIAVRNVTVGLHIHDLEGRLAYGTNTWLLGQSISVDVDATFDVVFSFILNLGVGRYVVGASVHTGSSHLERCFDWFDNCASFGVSGILGYHFDGYTNVHPSMDLRSDFNSARLEDVVSDRGGYISLGRLNPRIDPCAGYVRSTVPTLSIAAGDIFALEVEIGNEGDVPWQEKGRRCTKLCYRWLRENAEPLVLEGERSNIGGDLMPGEKRRVWMTVHAPQKYTGTAILRLTVVQEHVAWFDHGASVYADIRVQLGCGQEPAEAKCISAP
jgi:hypothetical protein